jgi:hypothetical protein
MGVKVKIVVKYQDGSPVVGARIHGRNNNAWFSSTGDWYGTTQHDGTHTWVNIDSGAFGDQYTFKVEAVDKEGIRWEGVTSERVSGDIEIPVVLSPSFSVGLKLPAGVVEHLKDSEDGRQILEGLREFRTALSTGLLRASVVLGTWLIEGMIRIRATTKGKWKDGYAKMTFGQLVAQEDLLGLFPMTLQPRIRALADFRTPNAHNTGAAPYAAEGQLTALIVAETAASWFGMTDQGPASAPPRTPPGLT